MKRAIQHDFVMRANVRPSRRFIWLALLSFSSGVFCHADEARPLPAGATIPIPAGFAMYLNQDAIREDLKLTADQRERIDHWRKELETAAKSTERPPPQELLARMAEQSDAAQTALEEILTPDQVRRHLQLMLQHAVVSQHGLTGLVQLTEVKEILRLDFDQQQKIEAIQEDAAAAAMARYRTNRPEPFGMFANPDLIQRSFDQQELADEIDRQISETLTAVQKQDLLDIFGPPLVGQVNPMFFTLPQPSPPQPAIGAVRRPRIQFPFMRGPIQSLPASGLGRETLAESSLNGALLTIESVRDELKISAERVQEEVLVGGDAAELARCIRQLDRWLEPAQLARLRQLVLQTEFYRRGPAAAFAFREVVGSLQLSDEQRATLEPLVKNELNSNRHSLVLAVESDRAKRAEIEKRLTDRLQGILTTIQRERLTELTGKATHIRASLAAINRALQPRNSARARTVATLGGMKLSNPLMLRMAAIQDELELSDEQREAVGDNSRMFGNPEKATDVLSEKQRKRFSEILLQGEARRDGPAAVLRYSPVIEALAPNADQQRLLLEIVQEDTRNYLRIPLDQFEERLPDLDIATATKLESVLTDEQREELAGLLGDPAHCIDEPARPARRGRP